MKRCVAVGFLVLLTVTLFADPATGWLQTGAGPYEYNDTNNWVNGEINGIFGSDLMLTAEQTITFCRDTSVSGLSLSQTGAFAITFKAAETTETARVTLTGDYQNSGAGAVTFDSSLTLDLGGGTRHFTSANDLVFQSVIENGGVVTKGAGQVYFKGANTYEGGSRFESSKVFFDNATAFGLGPVTFADGIALASSGAVKMTANNPLTLEGDLTYGSKFNNGLGAGDIKLMKPLTITVNNGYTLSISGQIAADSPYDITAITKTGNGSLATSAALEVPAGVEKVLNVAGTVWYWNGVITGGGTLRKIGGGNLQLGSSSPNFTGKLILDGGYARFMAKNTLGAGCTVLINANATLLTNTSKECGYAYSAAKMLNADLIDPASTGAIGLPSDETEFINLAKAPYIRLAPNSDNRAIKSISAPPTGVYRFGGGGKTLKIECALAADSDIDASMGSLQISANQPDFNGTVTMGNGYSFVLGSGISAPGMTVVGGMYTVGDKSAINGGVVRIATAAAGSFTSLKKVILNTSHFSIDTPSKGDTSLTVSEGVVLRTARGGVSHLTVPAGVTLNLSNLVQETGREMLNVNCAGKVLFDMPPAMVGEGTAGTVKVPVLPFVRMSNAMMTYDATDGLRALTDSEYESYAGGYEGEVVTPGANIRLTGTGTVTFTGSVAVNSLAVGNQTLSGGEGAVLSVSSGAVSVSSDGAANLAIPLNFGTRRGYLSYTVNKASTLNSAISGSGGLTISDMHFGSSSSGPSVYGTGSTFSGDVLLTGYIAIKNPAGFFPHGEELSEGVFRLGDLWLYGKIGITSGDCKICSLNGNGNFAPAGSSTSNLIFNNQATDGLFTGTIGQGNGKLNFGATKNGSGRQRLTGVFAGKWTCTVNGGTLQIDGDCDMGDRSIANHVDIVSGVLSGSGSVSSESTCGTIQIKAAGVLAPGAEENPNVPLSLEKSVELTQGARLRFAVSARHVSRGLVTGSLAGNATTVPVEVNCTVAKSGSWMLLEADSFGGKSLVLDRERSVGGGRLSVTQVLADDGETVLREQLWYSREVGLAIFIR